MRNNYLTGPRESKPFIIPIFVMNRGCPHRCLFCNQNISAGYYPQEFNRTYFEKEVESHLRWNKDKARHTEIAFYGGSFTNICVTDQERLLSFAQKYLQEGAVQALRISTRPDSINTDNLLLLKKYGVQTVEIGAQSFVDEVLSTADRGHNARAIEEAITLLQSEGFRTGVHLMAGLPHDTEDGFIYSLQKTVELKPDIARIHPALVFRGTGLAREFTRGNYRPLTLGEAVGLCRLAWERLAAAGISVIRIGLQITPEMGENGAVLAGPLHPAFGQLVLSSLFLDKIKKLLESLPATVRELKFRVASRDVSNFRGLQNSNMTTIKKLYPHIIINVKADPEQKRGIISAVTDQGMIMAAVIPGIN